MIEQSLCKKIREALAVSVGESDVHFSKRHDEPRWWAYCSDSKANEVYVFSIEKASKVVKRGVKFVRHNGAFVPAPGVLSYECVLSDG